MFQVVRWLLGEDALASQALENGRLAAQRRRDRVRALSREPFSHIDKELKVTGHTEQLPAGGFLSPTHYPELKPRKLRHHAVTR
jgi:hypothetical protein